MLNEGRTELSPIEKINEEKAKESKVCMIF